ncbi:hypothetical protein BHE97_06515 [Aeromicrobium sp. PE09-221]|nr:hypothetical protein BHE97_06515 [Aeromicrobium sp. PE09-221]
MVDIRGRAHDAGTIGVAEYRSTGVIVDPRLREVLNDTVVGVRLEYGGLPDWISNRIYHDDIIMEDGGFVGWRAELRPGRGTVAELAEGFSLRLSSGWSVAGEFDRRTFSTPLCVAVESDRRRPIGDHLVRLDAIHALLNIAHREPVKSVGGSARLTPGSEWCEFWQTDMMSDDAAAAASQSFPNFGLEEIGGIETIASWIALVLNHRRAVTPLVRHALVRNQTPESRLLSTAAAMEYWVAANRRSADWARRTDEKLPAALVGKVHSNWREWVGNSTAWVEQFWAADNHLKHQPQDDLDPQVVHTLEISGRWLLTAALLDEASGTNEPSRHIFGESLPLGNLGTIVRDAVEKGQVPK